MNIRKRKKIVFVLFAIYLVFLIKVILFKYPLPMIKTILKDFKLSSLRFRIEHGNFMPFKSIFEYLFNSKNIRISVKNLLGNIIAFMPFSFLMPLLTNRISKFKAIIISSFILSLSFECIQLLTGLGEFDVDDIILNVLGAVFGYLFYKIITEFVVKNCNYIN